jgi:hypothetical protein
MNNETQPLAEEQSHLTKEQAMENAQRLIDFYGKRSSESGTWVYPLVDAISEIQKERAEEANQHIHGPFTWLLNANHNALRGCTTCGQTWAGVMAGVDEADLRWHPVAEPDEEEED